MSTHSFPHPPAPPPRAGSLRPALTLLLGFTVLTGVAYPLAVTGVAQLLVPEKAGGSLVLRDGEAVGSALVGQRFDGDAWFWGRPSATAAQPYDGALGAASNLGPTNPVHLQTVRERVAALGGGGVPVDLVTASASGLDPDISAAAAYFQADRVARVRGLDPERIRDLVSSEISPPLLGFLGTPRVNVLALTLALVGVAGP